MPPIPHRAERLAELALSSTALQASSWRSVALLTDIAAGNAADLDPDQASQFAELALQAAVTAEIAAMRQAGTTGA
jgi:hypothetical protein